jgi:hypothetical protein
MFTPTIYMVERVIGVRGGVGSRRYILQKASGDRLMSHDYKTRHFRADALQRARGIQDDLGQSFEVESSSTEPIGL